MLSSLSKHIPFLLFPHTPDWVILISEALFLRLKVVFFAPRAFTWYHYCSHNWSGCGRPEARGQVRARPHTLPLPWQGIDCTIWQSQKERLTTMLSAAYSNYSVNFGTWLIDIVLLSSHLAGLLRWSLLPDSLFNRPLLTSAPIPLVSLLRVDRPRWSTDIAPSVTIKRC